MLNDDFVGVLELLALVDSDGVEGVEAVVEPTVDGGCIHDREELFAEFRQADFRKTLEVGLDYLDEFGFTR
jgi:hypothetical protein